MTAEQSLGFIVFAVVAAITPGPSNVMLTATGAQVGALRGLPCLLGIATGMGSLLFSAALGLGGLVLDHVYLRTGLKVLGAAFLLWLAWKIATARPSDGTGGPGRAVGFVEGALFQWINPKSWMIAVSATGAYLRPDAPAAPQAAWIVALFLTAALPCGLGWLAFGAAMQRLLRSPRAAVVFNRVMGAALAASVPLIAL